MNIEHFDSIDSHEYLVWDENYSRIIASARIKKINEGFELKIINVERWYRGEGVGSMLLNKIVADFSDTTLIAWVFSSRVEWYLKNGFKVKERAGRLVKVEIE
jgi:N-acetylglutamate synthase-like GNAT family acetyltransferase